MWGPYQALGGNGRRRRTSAPERERAAQANGAAANGVESADRQLLRYLEALDEQSFAPPDSAAVGLDYWLRRCDGFVVLGAARSGNVEQIRLGTDEVYGLIVRFGREVVLIRAADVATIDPERRLVRLTEHTNGAAPEAA